MTGKTILITGASGLLGSTLSKHLLGNSILTPPRTDFDVTNRHQVTRYISEKTPDIIIHTAAHTNVEEAETNPDLAWGINTIGTLNICKAIHKTTTKLVYISSTGVYGDAKQEAWREFDIVVPPTIHHQSKYKAEECIRNHIINHLILRTGWLFGGSTNNPKNFVYNRFKEAKNQSILFVNAQQFGNPTSAEDLTKQIELLLSEDIIGTYNCVNKNSVSRMDYIRDIVEACGLKTEVKPLEQEFKRLAKVSKNETAENYALQQMGLNIMNDYKPALQSYINSINLY